MRAILILLALVLLAPPAEAGWLVKTTIHTAPFREGDVYSLGYAWSYAQKGKDVQSGNGTITSTIEGPAQARDAFGIDRDAIAVRADTVSKGKLLVSERCYLLAHGNESIRTDVLSGDPGYGYTWKGPERTSLAGLQSSKTTVSQHPATFFGGACLVMSERLDFREGERVPIGDLAANVDMRGIMGDGLSRPAELTTFHGRDALKIAYPLDAFKPRTDGDSGQVAFLLADGLPGIVSIASDEVDGKDGAVSHSESELVGFQEGRGAEVRVGHEQKLPERNPAVQFAPLQPRSFDDSAWKPNLTFAEAIAALSGDSSTRFSSWMKDHPNAILLLAMYDRYARGFGVCCGDVSPEGTDGAWYIVFAENSANHAWWVARATAIDQGGSSGLPLPGLPVPPVHEPAGGTELKEGLQPWFKIPEIPEMGDGPDAQSLASLVAGAGVSPDKIETFTYMAMLDEGKIGSYTCASEVSSQRPDPEGTRTGHLVCAGTHAGSVTTIYRVGKQTESSSILPEAAAPLQEGPRASAFTALTGPASGAGLAGGAAVGLGLLILLLKFVLIPLFTRLRKDGLLDNPVRARLYERIRAEPGIHLAELTDFAGIGEGAARHHLDQLAKHRYVAVLREGGFVRYFAAGEVPPALARREAILRAGSVRAVYELYAQEPTLTLREAGARLGLSAPSVHRNKKRLEKEGLLPAGQTLSAPVTLGEA